MEKCMLKMEHITKRFHGVTALVELPSLPERQTVGGVAASIQIGKGKADIYSGADAAVVRAICQVLKSC